ncbi:hypothetical protein K9N68_34390 (plasmid) [Kovacikia minuta CCNUW1]|uniref:hypothetical protein n=1 Tax=Kovacikia minuta TaxID=2931930 RepID=UPI001CCC99D3|nr:hypothetical protein [Kovacikia minuta]UBF30305.1 hypothetical protein K9N68_34390 [Kovacikia minuta CCNUW1]
MAKQNHLLIGFTAVVVTAIGLSFLPHATAQIQEQKMPIGQVTPSARPTQTNFQGRGVAQGSAFTRGRNANVALTIDRDNFGLELAEPPGTRARVQYRGAIVRRNNNSGNSNSFTLDGRVRSFNSSANLRVVSNTTGTCRIEVFDARVISSSCRSAAPDSYTQFLGLEQF